MSLVVNKVTKGLVGVAAASVFALGAGSERGNSSESTATTTDLQECVNYFGDRAAANVPAESVAAITAVACGAMLSCETDQTTTEYLADYIATNQDAVAEVIAPGLPSAEALVSEHALRQCVLMETYGTDGTMSLDVRGKTPDIFFED